MITRISAPLISAAQSKFGGASAAILFNGGLSVPDGTHFDLSAGDFTMGCWVRRTNTSANDVYITKGIGNGSASAYLDDVFIVKGAAVGAALGTPAGELVPL